jgi:hypothetical protein
MLKRGRRLFQIRSRDVVNAVSTRCDDLADLFEAGLGRVVHLEGAAGLKSGPLHGVDDGPEEKLVLRIERAVDEDVPVGRGHPALSPMPF